MRQRLRGLCQEGTLQFRAQAGLCGIGFHQRHPQRITVLSPVERANRTAAFKTQLRLKGQRRLFSGRRIAGQHMPVNEEFWPLQAASCGMA